MRPRTTNSSTQTFDVYRFSFESAGALAFVNEYSGFAVQPAHYIAFAERKLARPASPIYHCRRCRVKPRSERPFTAHIGIDWADAKHDVCLQAADSEQREFGRFAHQVGSIDQWAKALHQRFGGPIAVALELAKGPIVYALQKYDFFVLFPINPATLAKYRAAFKPSGAKDDPTDAELALDLLLCHPERFTPLKPQSVAMRTLLSLIERRRELVADNPGYQPLGQCPQTILSASAGLVRAARYDPVLRFLAPLANCRNTPALHRSRNAAARSVGYTGGGSARGLSGKPSWNGPARPLTNRSGLASTIGSSATRAAPTKRRYVRWHTSGSAFFTAAGKPARPTTNQPISTRCASAAPPCSNSFIHLRKMLDGLPQGVKPPLTIF